MSPQAEMRLLNSNSMIRVGQAFNLLRQRRKVILGRQAETTTQKLKEELERIKI